MLHLLSGQSEENAISFYTKKNGIKAIRNENGEIEFEFEKPKLFLKQVLTSIFLLFGIILIIKVLIILPLITQNIIGFGWYLVPALQYLLFLILFIITLRKAFGISILKNHGAEHMVFSAYNRLGRIPTIEEAKPFSRINKNCGVTIFSGFITFQLIGFLVYYFTQIVIPELVLFVLPFLISSLFPFNLIGKVAQLFTTSVPEDEHLELAIAALSRLEEIELENPNESSNVLTNN